MAIDKTPIQNIPNKAFGDKHFASEFNTIKKYLLDTADAVNGLSAGYLGYLKISDPEPTETGLYKLLEIGAYPNLSPAQDENGDPTTITAQDGKINEAYFNGTFWIKSEVDLPGVVVAAEFDNTNETDAQGGKQIYDYLYPYDSDIRGIDLAVTLNSELSPDYTYYYKSAQINEGEEIVNINFQLHTAGTIDLILLDADNTVLHSEEKTGVVGNNTFTFSGISAIPKPYFPALKPKTSKLTTNFPADGDSSDGVWISPTNFVSPLGYKIPYNVEVSVLDTESIGGKLSTIQILTKSTTTEIQNQIYKTGKINALKREYLIEDTIQIPDGTHIDGCFGASIFKHSGFDGEIFNIEDRENVKIENIVLEGNKPNYAYDMNGVTAGANIISNLAEGVAGTYKENKHGINILRSENLILDSLVIRNFEGNGISVNRTGRDYIKGIRVSKIFIKDCHTGLFGINEHEYSSYSDMMISLCQVGQYFDSGNLMTTNSIFTRCRIGIIVDGGSNTSGSGFNHAHGTAGLLEVKHHQIAGLAFNNIVLGHYLPSVHMDYANILINNSNGVEVNGRMGYNCRFQSIGNPSGKPNVVNVSSMSSVPDDTVGTSNSILTVT